MGLHALPAKQHHHRSLPIDSLPYRAPKIPIGLLGTERLRKPLRIVQKPALSSIRRKYLRAWRRKRLNGGCLHFEHGRLFGASKSRGFIRPRRVWRRPFCKVEC